jgi:GT2 family glycosyltransferase
MDLSVIIVSFNTKKLLDDCLSSLLLSIKAAHIKAEVIVVDNVSKDGTREMLKEKYPKVMTILNRENVGFGRANNQGIRKASGEYILLLNSDTITPVEAIGNLYKFAGKNQKSFIGPKLLNTDGTPQTSCGPFFTLPVVFAALFLKGDVNGLTRWSPDEVKQVDWVSGACFIGKRALFLEDLLFDEQVFMYMEEVDLFMRAREKGYLTLFYPGSNIVHLGGGSSTNKRTGPVLNIYRGLLYVYKKHYSSFSLFVLKILLKAKALVSMSIGYVVGSSYLKQTYAEAYRLV